MTWNLIAHRSELANPGDYVLLTGGSQQALAYNDDGQIIVTDNVCLHRGARVFQGTHGNAPLKCPYHGFTGENVMKQMGLTAWVGDWLFSGDGSTNLEFDLAGFYAPLEGISQAISRRHSFDMMPMPCDWTMAVENSLEDLHVSAIHPDTFGKLKLEQTEMLRSGYNSLAEYRVGDERTVKVLTGLGKHFEDVKPDHYFHLFLWPFTCISSVGGLTFSVQQYLVNGGFTALHTRLYAAKTKADAPNLGYFFDEAAQFNRQVFMQDAEICARVQSPGTYLTSVEDRVKWFRQHLEESK